MSKNYEYIEVKMEKKGPLVGITVLDWTQWQMGPVATAMLADLGADVIHIEHHITGDPGRGLNASDTAEFVKGKHSYFEVNNRGKKSITINLQIDEGKEILYRLIEKADVFVHNFRQGVPERLKVDYNTLKKYNPRLIYAAASGFGVKGPDASVGALDLVSLARSGISTLFATDDNPGIPHYGGLGDQAGAIFTAYGILAALIARERYGVGQKVDSSLLMSMITWQGLMLGKALYLNKPAVRQDRKKPRNVLWNFYKCKDEKWIVLAMLQSQRYWPEVCKALGSEYLINNPRFRDDLLREKNSQELVLILDGIFEQKTADEWNKILHDGYDIISTPVQSLNDLPEDPQVIANEYVINYNHESIGPVKIVGLPVALSKTPGKVIAEAPEFGQHTEEVLIELGGYTWEDITALRRKKAI
jgi:crotonobetainyl-CoA:carnitine CoA-transferase CaiB-like acyl-CoA transferase